MATTIPSPYFPRPSPRRRRLTTFLLLAFLGICLGSMFYTSHKVCKLNRHVSRLENQLYDDQNTKSDLRSTKNQVQNFYSIINKHQEHLNKVSADLAESKQYISGVVTKMVQELNTAMATQSKDTTTIKKELEAFESVIQAIMTSQVNDIKRHEDIWKAIHNVEASLNTRVDAESAAALFQLYDNKFQDVTTELNLQKVKAEELSETQRKQAEELASKAATIEILLENNTPEVEVPQQAEHASTEYDTTYRQTYKTEQKEEQKSDSESKESKKQESYGAKGQKAIDAALKEMNEMTHKVVGKIEQQAERVAEEVSQKARRVRKAFSRFFG